MEQATGLIEGGPTPVSQQLPSERELVNQLGVCRAAVREALTVLEAQGLIDVQPGRGAYLMVTAARADIVSGIVGWLNSHGREYEEVNELIRLLEGYAASLAARTAS
jgi:GntR family transcriptional repressor for pyruvate dehydrogenase complex